MNKIIAEVQEINETEIVTYIHVNSGDTVLHLTKSKKPAWLHVGDKVSCSFQEVAVCMSKDCPGKLSIENILPVQLKNVRKCDSLCELTLESKMGKIVSLITANAYDDLELHEGCEAMVLLRGVDISLDPILVPMKAGSF